MTRPSTVNQTLDAIYGAGMVTIVRGNGYYYFRGAHADAVNIASLYTNNLAAWTVKEIVFHVDSELQRVAR